MSEEKELALYHSIESTCAQKVRLVMTAKKLCWKEERLNLRKGEQFKAAYLKLNPKAVVPTLVHGANVIRESSVINEYLDDVFPEPALKPADPGQRAEMRLLIKTFDDEVHPSTGILTYAIVMRHQMNELKTAEELKQHFKSIVDSRRRERQEKTHMSGLESEYAEQAMSTLNRVFSQMQVLLSKYRWLAGADYSLADAAAAPYLERARVLGLQGLWKDRPDISRWLTQVYQQENCQQTENPWGTEDFTEVVCSYSRRDKTQIDKLLQVVSSRDKKTP